MPTSANGEARDYLMNLYNLYQTHINNMLSFYLVVAGLLLNAYVQCLSPDLKLPWHVTFLVAILGFLLSLVFLLIHVRSRDLLDTIEAGLRHEEVKMFPEGGGFLIFVPKKRTSWFFRHKYQFPVAYGAFIVSFLAMAVFAWKCASPI